MIENSGHIDTAIGEEGASVGKPGGKRKINKRSAARRVSILRLVSYDRRAYRRAAGISNSRAQVQSTLPPLPEKLPSTPMLPPEPVLVPGLAAVRVEVVLSGRKVSTWSDVTSTSKTKLPACLGNTTTYTCAEAYALIVPRLQVKPVPVREQVPPLLVVMLLDSGMPQGGSLPVRMTLVACEGPLLVTVSVKVI